MKILFILRDFANLSMMKENNKRDCCATALYLFIYWGFPVIASRVIEPFHRISGVSWIRVLFMVLFDILTIVAIVVLQKERIMEEWLSFFHERKKSKITKLLWVIPYYLISAFLHGLCSYVIHVLTQIESMNQSGLDALQYSDNIWISTTATILIVVTGPIIEEMIFRFGVYRPLRNKNKILAYIVSSLLFGLIHVLGPVIDGYTSQLLLIIPYGISGFFYAKYYEKCDNIFYPILLHSISNIIASIL